MAYSTKNSASVVSVTNFGVRGDGITENRATLQEAINSLYPKQGGTLLFPRGTYYYSGTLNLTGAGIELVGEEGSVLKAFPNEETKKFNISGASDIKIEGLTFDYSRTGTSAGSNQNGFVNTFNSEYVLIQNNSFINTKSSLIYLGGGSKFVDIQNNYFSGYHCALYAYVNSGERSSQRFNISNNTFDKSDVWVAAEYEAAAIKLQCDPNGTGAQIGHVIDGNVIDVSLQMGVELWKGGRENVISNNTVANTIFGISLDGQENCSVVGNTLKTNSYVGIEAATVCRNISIVGNNINGFSGATGEVTRINSNGISCTNLQGDSIIIDSNIAEGCGKGVYLQNCSNVILSNNILRANDQNLNFEGASLAQISNNLFDVSYNTGTTTNYHIFFDSNYATLSGFHVNDNKFRGPTLNQSIFFYPVGGSGINGVCMENNFTDGTCNGGYGAFVERNGIVTNYNFRNNFGPTGATSANSIVDASDSTAPYKSSDIENGFTYYGSSSWVIPNGGITGNGIWLCLWSGGGGYQNNVRAKISNGYEVDNNYNNVEFWATMIPYEGFFFENTLAATPFGIGSTVTPYKQAKTLSHNSVANNSLWVRVGPTSTGIGGASFSVKYSQANNLTGVYATYIQPTDTQNNANLYLDTDTSLNQAYKFSNGISVGDQGAVSFYSPSSGTFDFVGNLNSPLAYNRGNSDASYGLRQGLAVSFYTGLYSAWAPSSSDQMNAMFQTGVRFVSGGYLGNLSGYSANATNYATEFVGYFLVTGQGNHTFGVNSDDASDLWIDGKLAAYWYGGHSSGTAPGGTQNTLFLSSGLHRFWGRFQDAGTNSVYQAWVKTPADTGTRIIQPNQVFSESRDYLFRNNENNDDLSIWGNVGINTTKPSANIDINGTLNVSGNVGIGLANPMAQLHVATSGFFGTGIVGNTNGSIAATGIVGEYVSGILLQASAVSLTTSTAANVTSVSLTAGDWDVGASIVLLPDAATITNTVVGAINTTSATLPPINAFTRVSNTSASPGGLNICMSVPYQRYNLTATTTVYLIGFASFTTSTMTACGKIFARRVR